MDWRGGGTIWMLRCGAPGRLVLSHIYPIYPIYHYLLYTGSLLISAAAILLGCQGARLPAGWTMDQAATDRGAGLGRFDICSPIYYTNNI